MREIKRALRRELIERRKAMSCEIKQAADRDIFCRLKPLADKASAVFTYVSTEIEVDTHELIGYCLEQKIPLAVPVSGNSELSFYYIDSMAELAPGRFNIYEPIYRDKRAFPDSAALCVVPALCADGDGLRLGYGRGYYDRYLAGFCGTSVIICYGSFKRAVPAEKHDFRADLTIFDTIT